MRSPETFDAFCSHAMSSVTRRAGESRVDVECVLAEAGVGNNVVQVVTLGTQGVRPAQSVQRMCADRPPLRAAVQIPHVLE